ncbi:hypothetical protein QAD02_007223 [Eretmocerus hayati]|uniref:Uncharacterized protein n=1 Tax=Eretmocerus hayati TaxID=131215 RepID=A0ACC2N4E0_9HYME|nr:hypothetical protein QAD02_007223 [Eretmocerus hayati]
MSSEAVNPIPQWAEFRKHYYSMEGRNVVENPTVRRTPAVIHDAYSYRYTSPNFCRSPREMRTGQGKTKALNDTWYIRIERQKIKMLSIAELYCKLMTHRG